MDYPSTSPTAGQRATRTPFQTSVFRVAGHRRRDTTRSQFTAEGRNKVQLVRDKRACLRCKALKIPCSALGIRDEPPCNACFALATQSLHTTTTSALAWSYCIRTKFRNVNIFSKAFDQNTVSVVLTQLGHRDLSLAFDVRWDLEDLVQTVTNWLIDNGPSSKSMVGMLSSDEFRALAADHLDHRLVEDVCLLLYSTSHVHLKRLAQSKSTICGVGIDSLLEAIHFTGQAVLNKLDDTLSPKSLAGVSKETLQAKFLLVFAVVVAVSYTTQLTESPPFHGQHEGNAHSPSPTVTLWEMMRQHVCEMLSHYLILIASRLRVVRFQPSYQQILITSAIDRWKKKGRFTWVSSALPTDRSDSVEAYAPGIARRSHDAAIGVRETLANESIQLSGADTDYSPINTCHIPHFAGHGGGGLYDFCQPISSADSTLVYLSACSSCSSTSYDAPPQILDPFQLFQRAFETKVLRGPWIPYIHIGTEGRDQSQEQPQVTHRNRPTVLLETTPTLDAFDRMSLEWELPGSHGVDATRDAWERLQLLV